MNRTPSYFARIARKPPATAQILRPRPAQFERWRLAAPPDEPYRPPVIRNAEPTLPPLAVRSEIREEKPGAVSARALPGPMPAAEPVSPPLRKQPDAPAVVRRVERVSDGPGEIVMARSEPLLEPKASIPAPQTVRERHNPEPGPKTPKSLVAEHRVLLPSKPGNAEHPQADARVAPAQAMPVIPSNPALSASDRAAEPRPAIHSPLTKTEIAYRGQPAPARTTQSAPSGGVHIGQIEIHVLPAPPPPAPARPSAPSARRPQPPAARGRLAQAFTWPYGFHQS